MESIHDDHHHHISNLDVSNLVVQDTMNNSNVITMMCHILLMKTDDVDRIHPVDVLLVGSCRHSMTTNFDRYHDDGLNNRAKVDSFDLLE